MRPGATATPAKQGPGQSWGGSEPPGGRAQRPYVRPSNADSGVVGRASSLPVFGASCPKFPGQVDNRTPKRGCKPLGLAGRNACPTAPDMVGRASSLPVFGASCPKFPERRDNRTPKRGCKPLELAGRNACPTAPDMAGQASGPSAPPCPRPQNCGDGGFCLLHSSFCLLHFPIHAPPPLPPRLRPLAEISED